MKDGALCGVFDGHGKNGHIVSKFVRNKLHSLLLNQKNALTKVNNTVGYGCNFLNHNEKAEGENLPNKDFNKWEEACVNAFKVMDKEIKLIESLDCSCSGTTAVVVIRQVCKRKSPRQLKIHAHEMKTLFLGSWYRHLGQFSVFFIPCQFNSKPHTQEGNRLLVWKGKQFLVFFFVSFPTDSTGNTCIGAESSLCFVFLSRQLK